MLPIFYFFDLTNNKKRSIILTTRYWKGEGDSVQQQTEKQRGRKKKKRLSLQEIHQIVLNYFQLPYSAHVIDLDIKYNTFIFVIRYKYKTFSLDIPAMGFIRKINQLLPDDYKKYNSSKEFYLEYNKSVLDYYRKRIEQSYGENIENYEYVVKSGDECLLHNKQNKKYLSMRYSDYKGYMTTLKKYK